MEILALTRFARRGKDLPDVFSDFGTEAVNVGGPAFEKATMLIDARRPRVGLKLDDEMGVQGVAATILLTDTVHTVRSEKWPNPDRANFLSEEVCFWGDLGREEGPAACLRSGGE